MELAFIIGVIGTWAIIALSGLADKIGRGCLKKERSG